MLSRPVPDAWTPPGRVLSPMTDDFYCDEVLSGRTAVRVVHETEHTLAYHHTRPHWPVHIVVIPKVHVPSLTDLGEAPDREHRDERSGGRLAGPTRMPGWWAWTKHRSDFWSRPRYEMPYPLPPVAQKRQRPKGRRQGLQQSVLSTLLVAAVLRI